MSKICAPSNIAPSSTEETSSPSKGSDAGQREPIQKKSCGGEGIIQSIADRLLSDRDVAARYKVEKQTIWRWARTSSSFPKPFKIEGTARWSENELDEHDRKLKEARR